MPNTGKITQIIGAVLDIKFTEGHLPSIYEAIHITRKNGERSRCRGRTAPWR